MCNITGNSLGTIFSLDQNNQNMKNSKLVFFQERAVEFNNTMLIGGIYENEEKDKSHKYGKELQQKVNFKFIKSKIKFIEDAVKAKPFLFSEESIQEQKSKLDLSKKIFLKEETDYKKLSEKFSENFVSFS